MFCKIVQNMKKVLEIKRENVNESLIFSMVKQNEGLYNGFNSYSGLAM